MVTREMKLYNDFIVPVDFYEAENARAICIIIHGMQEHKGRYYDFAKVLNNNNITAIVPELRGHGEFWNEGEEGYSNGDIFIEITSDMTTLFNKIKEETKLPIYVLGHSFGSFITQRLILENLEADKFVLSGSSYMNTFEVKLAALIARIACKCKKEKNTAKMLEKMSFGAYAKHYPNGNWLTRDESVFNYYLENKYCGHPFPYNFYKSFFTNAPRNYKNLKCLDKSHEILMITGEKDPVSKCTKLIPKLQYTYKKAGFNVESVIFEGARHEVLNETNKNDVYSTVLQFFDKE